jgi:hypothetical protein
VLNSRVTHLALSSNQFPPYIHSSVRQGHTNRGQALGSVAGYGGGAGILALDRYHAAGRITMSWERLQLAESRESIAPPDLFENDVAHVWRVQSLRFGRRANMEIGAALIYEINRQLRGDAVSFQTSLSVLPGSLRR